MTVQFLRGNPTQRVEKLFEMMKRGIAGGEGVAAFDSIFKDVDGNKQHNAYDADGEGDSECYGAR